MTKLTKPETVGLSSERLKNIGESMRSLIDSKKIPGTVTLVARKGEVVHFEANGKRDIERDLPMEIDTIHRIYSQSKPITGAALMMLFEEGKFLMTDPVAKYLPEFSDMQVCVGEENGKMKTEAATSPITHTTACFTYFRFVIFIHARSSRRYVYRRRSREGLGKYPKRWRNAFS